MESKQGVIGNNLGEHIGNLMGKMKSSPDPKLKRKKIKSP
jgi:hypothetical protein